MEPKPVSERKNIITSNHTSHKETRRDSGKCLYKLGLTALILLFLTACVQQQAGEPQRRSDFALNTVCTISIMEGGNRNAMNAAFTRLHELEQKLSARLDSSQLMGVNNAAGKNPVKVDKELFFVVQKALHYAQLSEGNFDPTIDPLSRLWDIQGGTERIPEPAEIAAALKLVDASKVVLDAAKSTIYLTEPGMSLDLGGIAKGYAADELGAVLRANGVKSAIIDLGGNIVTLGQKTDGSPWRIAIKNPIEPDGQYLGILSLSGSATMVTSGVYERYFIGPDGRRYHHIISTADGYPVDNGVISVTIIADSSLDADALSTALLAMGIEKGLILAESLPGVEAIFADHQLALHATSGISGQFVIVDRRFSWHKDTQP